MQRSANVVEVGWDDPRAAALRAAMDLEMGAVYADTEGSPEAGRILRLDPADVVATALVLDGDGTPVAHAALRRRDTHPDAFEVKKVIVVREARGRGLSYPLMGWLEERARQLGATRLVLHTGSRQPDAIHVYERLGYARIPPFPPYDRLGLSVCMEKTLDPG